MPATACLICQIHTFMWTCWTTWTVIIAPLTMTSRKDESYWNLDYLISVIRKTRFEGDDIGWRQMTLYWRRSTGDAKRLLQYEEQDSTAFFRGNNTSRYVVSDHFVCNFLDKAFYTCQFWSQNLNIFIRCSCRILLSWHYIEFMVPEIRESVNSVENSWNGLIIFPMERHWTDS